MARDLTNDEENQLIELLSTMLDPTQLAHIDAASKVTNLKWSSVVNLALTIVDWEVLAAALNVAEEKLAIQEAEDIINPGQT